MFLQAGQSMCAWLLTQPDPAAPGECVCVCACVWQSTSTWGCRWHAVPADCLLLLLIRACGWGMRRGGFEAAHGRCVEDVACAVTVRSWALDKPGMQFWGRPGLNPSIPAQSPWCNLKLLDPYGASSSPSIPACAL